jgi:hypothetical protein
MVSKQPVADVGVGVSRDELLRLLGQPTTTRADDALLANDEADGGIPPPREIWIYQDVPPGYRTTVVLNADRVVSRHKVLTASATARIAQARARRPVCPTCRSPETSQPTNTMVLLAAVIAGVALGYAVTFIFAAVLGAG